MRGKNLSILTLVLAVMTAFGVGCSYLKVGKNESPKPSGESNSNISNSNISNSNNSIVSTNKPQTFSDPNPEKKADFQMNANDFEKEEAASDYEKFKGKVVELSGRVLLLRDFDGNELHFRTEESLIGFKISSGEADKLNKIKESERLRIKCNVSDIGLTDCIVLERKPVVIADEKADISVTAKEYYEQVVNPGLDLEVMKKNRKKYFGKVIDITGEVRGGISGGNAFLKARGIFSVLCNYDEDSTKQFESLKEGQQATFRATDNGISLLGCIVVR